MAADEFGLALRGLRLECRGNGVDVVSVHLVAVEAEASVSVNYVTEAHHLLDLAVYLKAVVVEDDREVVELVVAGRHCGLPYQPLLRFAVAGYGVDMIVFPQMLRGQRHSSGHGHTLSEGAGVGVNSRSFEHVGVSLKVRVDLAEIPQILSREEAEIGQNRVLRRAGMSLRQHDPVAIRCVRIPRVNVCDVVIQRHHQLNA